jgi:hypothetical protein
MARAGFAGADPTTPFLTETEHNPDAVPVAAIA